MKPELSDPHGRNWLRRLGVTPARGDGSASPLPPEVLAELVDSLYAPLLSLVVAAGCGVLVAVIVSARNANTTGLIDCALAMVLIALWRAALTILYRNRNAHAALTAKTLGFWELNYAICALTQAAAFGALCFITMVSTNDPIGQLLVDATTIGYTAGVTARNTGRLRVAIGQLTLALGPLTAGATLRGGLEYYSLALLTFLYFLAAVEIAGYLSRKNLRLLLLNHENKALISNLAEQHRRLDIALGNMSHGLCTFDSSLRLVLSNERTAELFGLPPESFQPGMTVREMVALSVEAGNHENQSFAKVVEDFENKLAQRSETSSTIELKGERTVSWSPRALEDGGAVVIFEDVTERLSAESQSQYLSTHDSLTGLPNRILFDRMLEQTIKMARRYEKRFCVMFLDLDRFKAINDTLGHAAGDVMLQEVATRLRTNLRESDVVARLGGDEFVMIIQEVGNASQAETVAQKIVENIARPLTIQGQECATGASIGIAMFPVDASDEKSLIKCADAAMYRAKEEGKNRFQFFSSGAAVPSLRSLKFESDLRHALEREEFVLLYQPKKDIATGAIAGVEAQLRWSHPESGILASDSFLQLAEETGLMISIGKWALETACRQNVAWSREGIKNLRVAVDISQRQLLSRDLLGDIEAALSSSGMSAELLELEISESALLRDHERSDDLLQSMRRAGMRVTIDDFGAGYSSLSRLKELPVDAIKIDRSVIQGLLVDQRDQAIVQAIITMARALGLTTVADGVETRGQEAFLKAHACDQMQGSLFSRPVPGDAFGAFARDHELRRLQQRLGDYPAPAVAMAVR